MRLLSWNVNGIRAVLGKGFPDFVAAENPDILCLQETKARPEQVQLPLELGGYQAFWSSAEKPGYSGVAVFTREKPLEVTEGLGIDHHDREGRVLTVEFPDFILVNVYTPNAQDELRRLDYRLSWDEAFRQHVRQWIEANYPPELRNPPKRLHWSENQRLVLEAGGEGLALPLLAAGIWRHGPVRRPSRSSWSMRWNVTAAPAPSTRAC